MFKKRSDFLKALSSGLRNEGTDALALNSTHYKTDKSAKPCLEKESMEVEKKKIFESSNESTLHPLHNYEESGNEGDDDEWNKGDDSDIDPDYVPGSADSDELAYDIEKQHPCSSSDDSSQSFPIVSPPRIPPEFFEEGSDTSSHTSEIHKPSTSTKNKRIRQKNYCMYCESMVTNFARHVYRNHKFETDVQNILAKPKLSKERKHLMTLLRNKGNFIENANGCVKPVKMPTYEIDPSKYLPCSHCLGYYSKKQLWRHRKKCGQGNVDSQKSHQVSGQNLLLGNRKYDKELKDKVFPRMRPDNVSLVAKQDQLICAFGARYIKIHREQHFVNVASRKMRELAKILIELRKLSSTIDNMFTALLPHNYDFIVDAAKVVGKYDRVKNVYHSPTFAMNIATSLKQCCEIAITLALKRKQSIPHLQTAEMEANFKTMIKLIESNWRYDVSNQAADDLNVKSWNKISLVPLASDLLKLKDYLIKCANRAAEELQVKQNKKSYLTLMETTFCRIILLNRKRPGELQRLPLHIYETEGKIAEGSQGYEEFNEAISVTERVLAKRFKRLVIKGKRNRGVPVLFSPDVQEHLTILINNRSHFIPIDNIYLFANPDTKNPINGYKIVQKYGKACGAKNPNAITCTKLRKHLATLTQLINMSSTDMEQLAKFMGHTLGVHQQAYRLPDNVFQTAKLSKLLLLMEEGKAGQYKGKTLDEINLNLDVEEEIGDGDKVNSDEGEDFDLMQAINTPSSSVPKMQSTKCKRVLVPWTDEQKKIVLSFFKKHIKRRKPPKRNECEELYKLHPGKLDNKSWQKIKVYIQNQYIKT